MADRINALKEWTGKACATIIYDSMVDEFTHDGLFDKVKGKLNVVLVGFTADSDVFGVFYSVAVTEQQGIQRPKHLRVLVRVPRAVRDAAAVHGES